MVVEGAEWEASSHINVKLSHEFLKWYELFTTAIIGDILKNKCFEYWQKMNVCTFQNTELYTFEEWQKFNRETMSSRLWQFFSDKPR